MPPVLNLLSAERLQTVIFKKPENFKKHSCLLMNAVREGFKALGQELSEPLGAKIWSLLVARINQLLEKGLFGIIRTMTFFFVHFPDNNSLRFIIRLISRFQRDVTSSPGCLTGFS